MLHEDVELAMTQETLFDALVYADIPSRTVLTSVLQDGLLKKSIFASNAFIYHFDDIRDGIDLVLKNIRSSGEGEGEGDKHIFGSWISTGSGFSGDKASIQSAAPQSETPLVFHLNNSTLGSSNCLKMNELFDSEEVRFACSRASEELLNSRREGSKTSAINLPSATILVSLDFLDLKRIPFENVDELVETIKDLLTEYGGPVLAFSELKRNLRTGCAFKFFVEFYRISDCTRFLKTSENIGGGVVSDGQDVKVSFEGVHLYDIDREALFFTVNDSIEPTGEVRKEADYDCEFREQKQADNIASTTNQRRKDSISSIDGNPPYRTY